MDELEFGGQIRRPDVRRLYDLNDVICDKAWLAKAENFPLYYMYRDLYLSKADKDRLMDQDLRYDITIIPPKMLGREYIKTAGHYHPQAPGTSVSYPELYEVLEGEALYLLQNKDLSDAVVIYASAGDRVLVPPDYGHVTVNRSNKTLRMSNFVARSFSSIYEPFKEMGGATYFCTTEGFVENKKYPRIPELRRVDAPDSRKLKALGLTKGKEMYPLMKDVESLDYLFHPGEHMDLFTEFLQG
jgi:glucose-6-phosphate isomerase